MSSSLPLLALGPDVPLTHREVKRAARHPEIRLEPTEACQEAVGDAYDNRQPVGRGAGGLTSRNSSQGGGPSRTEALSPLFRIWFTSCSSVVSGWGGLSGYERGQSQRRSRGYHGRQRRSQTDTDTCGDQHQSDRGIVPAAGRKRGSHGTASTSSTSPERTVSGSHISRTARGHL